MFRLHCTKTNRPVLAGFGSMIDLVNTTRGPVAHVSCLCGATITVEAGVQTCHEIAAA